MLKNFNGIKYSGRRHYLPQKKEKSELILKFQRGELDSFGYIYKKFQKPIFKFILRQIKSRDISEELTQDIFLKVYQYRKSYDPQYEISTWIWTIARNTVIDYLRQSRPITTDYFSFENEIYSQTQVQPSQSVQTAESLMIEEIERAKLMQLMSSLSNKQQEVIFLRLVKKLSYQEISNSMNLSLSAVKSLINRAKSTLIKLHIRIQNSPEGP